MEENNLLHTQQMFLWQSQCMIKNMIKHTSWHLKMSLEDIISFFIHSLASSCQLDNLISI